MNKKFDLVLIDGPLAHKKGLSLSRYPTLHFLFTKGLLNLKCSVYLDDIQRKAEMEIIKRWEVLFKCKFNPLYAIKNKFFWEC
jgi:hypothetical protein